jgi:hypothetical protein
MLAAIRSSKPAVRLGTSFTLAAPGRSDRVMRAVDEADTGDDRGSTDTIFGRGSWRYSAISE